MPAAVEQKPKSNDRKAGLILIAVGVGLYFFFSAGNGNQASLECALGRLDSGANWRRPADQLVP